MKGLIGTIIAVQRDYCRAHGVSPFMAAWEAVQIAIYSVAIGLAATLLLVAMVPA
ncbi:MAG: hypothetical protein U9R07_11820 [Pseudomonadota bacterium]|nr:hypothetical protein [Pseudomonadota bacterium]